MAKEKVYEYRIKANHKLEKAEQALKLFPMI
jgi:hypothetical protein